MAGRPPGWIVRGVDRAPLVAAGVVGSVVAVASYIVLIQLVQMLAFAHGTEAELLAARGGTLFAGPVLLGLASFAVTLIAGRTEGGSDPRDGPKDR